MRTLPTDFRQVSDLNEIIFANRNKLYGAYELRKHYNERLLKAFLITASTTLLLLLIVTAAVNRKTMIDGTPIPGFGDPLPPIIFPLIDPPVTPPSGGKSTDIPTRIVDESEVSDSTKEDSTNIASSTSNNSLLHDSIPSSTGIVVDTLASIKNPEPDYFDNVQVMPSFPGGQEAFSRYIQRHFNCNDSYSGRENKKGKLILRFVIMNDGSLMNIEVLHNDLGIECANSAIMVLQKSPHWSPGLQNKMPVNVRMVLPITVQQE